MPRPKIIVIDKKTAYLPGVKAAITTSSDIIADPVSEPLRFSFPDAKLKRVVPWGESNDLPQQLIEQVYSAPVAIAGLQFNTMMAYGDGVCYGSLVEKNNKLQFVERRDNDEINQFFLDNDIDNFILEQCNDIVFFYNIFPEIGLSRDAQKIISLTHKEAAFSRWEEMDKDSGLINHHFYSAKWPKGPKVDEITATPVLKPYNTLTDLQIRMGIIPNDTGKKNKPSHFRFIIPVNMPTPGRNYYQKPFWYTIIESGWLDYSKKIPEFKNALLDNQMVIKYHVELSDDYFDKIFKAENLTTHNAQQERIKKEYADLNRFLGQTKNSGKSVISFVKYDSQGRELRRMKIHVIENKFKGGEYIEDSEEASNIISYAMGVHPSLIGSSPGKNKNINGTEARELFIIKQSLMKPIRDRILRSLYLVKHYNNWPKDIFFSIPNLVLTTLDKNSGSEKIIS